MYWSLSASHSKSARAQVPSVRPDLSKTGMCGAISAVDQPAQHRSGAVGGVGDQAFGMQVEPGLHPIQHGLGRSDLGLPDRPRGLDIDDHGVIRVDQVVGGIG